MGIKTSNLVVTSKPDESVKAAPAVAIIEPKPKINNMVVLNKQPKPVENKQDINSLKGSKLVVDGKVKNISKKSAFLLDMLTLDDDQPK